MRLGRIAWGLLVAGAACSLADFQVAATFDASADPYVRISTVPDASALLAVTVTPGPALRDGVTVSFFDSTGMVAATSIVLGPEDASTWASTLTLRLTTDDAGASPTLLDASVRFVASGSEVDVPVTVRVGSNLAIVTPATCDFGGPTLAGPTCTFTVPPDAPNLVVWAIAGGGGGGAGTTNDDCVLPPAHGGNGGGGGFVVAQIMATPGSTLRIVAGTGGSPGVGVNDGKHLATGGGGGGMSGIFEADGGAVLIVGGGGGGGGGACVASSPIHGVRGGGGSGYIGESGGGQQGGSGGTLDAGGVTGAPCDSTVILANGGSFQGGGCVNCGTSMVVCAGGGPLGGGNGYAISGSISGGGGGGGGWFGGGAGGGQCNNAGASGGGGGSSWVSPALLVDAAVYGTVDAAGPGGGGNGTVKAPDAGGAAGFVYVTLP